MAEGGVQAERLRQYLLQLSPQARALLMAELERTALRGDEVPGGNVLLNAVRGTLREEGESAPRVDSAARLFFRPVEPFLVPEDPPQPQRGRIPRKVLDPIWDWIVRDLLPDEARDFASDVSEWIAVDDSTRLDHLTYAFQDRALARMQKELSASSGDEKTRRRLAAQLGAGRGLDDVRQVIAALDARDELARIGNRLPAHIGNLSDEHLEAVKSLLDHAAPRGELLTFALALTMGRLSAPWQLIRLAVKAAESDDIARIATSPYLEAIALVLCDIERAVRDLRADLKRGGHNVVGLLKWLHDAVRGLRSEIDLGLDSPQARRLAAIRAEIASVLKTEIESMPGRVRRLLRPRPSNEIASGAALDATEVNETEALIEVVNACRGFASELAVSEMTLRTWSELEHYLDNNTQPLVDTLRTARDNDRPFRQSQVDAAVRFCAVVFGRQHAAVLRKAAEVAVNSERKAAQA